jgi:hypothetical protein
MVLLLLAAVEDLLEQGSQFLVLLVPLVLDELLKSAHILSHVLVEVVNLEDFQRLHEELLPRSQIDVGDLAVAAWLGELSILQLLGHLGIPLEELTVSCY